MTLTEFYDATVASPLTIGLLTLCALLSFTVGGLLIAILRTGKQQAQHPKPPDTQPMRLSDLFPDLDAVADDLASRRIGEPTDATGPLLGTLPPVAPPVIYRPWPPEGLARAETRWLSGDFDRTAAELARHFREREDQR